MTDHAVQSVTECSTSQDQRIAEVDWDLLRTLGLLGRKTWCYMVVLIQTLIWKSSCKWAKVSCQCSLHMQANRSTFKKYVFLSTLSFVYSSAQYSALYSYCERQKLSCINKSINTKRMLTGGDVSVSCSEVLSKKSTLDFNDLCASRKSGLLQQL